MRKLEREHVIRVLETHGPYPKGDVRSPPMRTSTSRYPVSWGFAVAQYRAAAPEAADQPEAKANTAPAAKTARAEAEHAREWAGRRQEEVHQTPPSSTPDTSMRASARAALGTAPNGVGGAAKPSLADIHFLSPLAGGKWNEEVPEAEFIHWAVHAGDKVLEIGALP